MALHMPIKMAEPISATRRSWNAATTTIIRKTVMSYSPITQGPPKKLPLVLFR
jgi:hypothetical protein